MKQSELEKYRAALLELRPQLVQEIEHRVETLPEELIAPGDDWQEPNEGLESELEVARSERSLLEQVAAALRRIDEGTYGICVDCGRSIAPERLDAIPYTAYCIECELQHEKE